MQHRYGRHGSHAWKQRRDRLYGRRPSVLPVPVVPSPTIVRVIVPKTAERIILIIMSDSTPRPEEWSEDEAHDIDIVYGDVTHPQRPQEVESDRDTDGLAQLPASDRQLRDLAWSQAVRDALRIARIVEDTKQPVLIDPKKLEEKARSQVYQYIQEHTPSEVRIPDPAERQRLVSVYFSAYQRALKENLESSKKHIIYCDSPQELRLYTFAIEDRENDLDDKGDLQDEEANSHLRDLAVIRVLQIFEIHPEQASRFPQLAEVHRRADEYQRYYRIGKEAISWPSQATEFRA